MKRQRERVECSKEAPKHAQVLEMGQNSQGMSGINIADSLWRFIVRLSQYSVCGALHRRTVLWFSSRLKSSWELQWLSAISDVNVD